MLNRLFLVFLHSSMSFALLAFALSDFVYSQCPPTTPINVAGFCVSNGADIVIGGDLWCGRCIVETTTFVGNSCGWGPFTYGIPYCGNCAVAPGTSVQAYAPGTVSSIQYLACQAATIACYAASAAGGAGCGLLCAGLAPPALVACAAVCGAGGTTGVQICNCIGTDCVSPCTAVGPPFTAGVHPDCL